MQKIAVLEGMLAESPMSRSSVFAPAQLAQMANTRAADTPLVSRDSFSERLSPLQPTRPPTNATTLPAGDSMHGTPVASPKAPDTAASGSTELAAAGSLHGTPVATSRHASQLAAAAPVDTSGGPTTAGGNVPL